MINRAVRSGRQRSGVLRLSRRTVRLASWPRGLTKSWVPRVIQD
jgi:hypothetical protein